MSCSTPFSTGRVQLGMPSMKDKSLFVPFKPKRAFEDISDQIKIGNVTLRELTEVRLGIEKAILEYSIKNINQNDLKLLKENIEETQKTFLKGGRATDFYTH